MASKLSKVALRTSLIYWLISMAWILLSDRVVGMFSLDPSFIIRMSTYKGWAFVTATSILLYVALRNQLHRWQVESEKRKEAVRAILDYEERFREIYDVAPVGISNITADGKFISCNPALEKILGYSESELQAISIDEVTHPEDRDKNAGMFRDIAEGRISTGSLEKRYIRKDGQVVWVHLTSSGVYDSKGNFLRAVSITQDITERKLAEEKIKRLNRVYTVLSNINQLIARVQVKQALLAEACRIAVDVGKFELAWISLADERSGEIKPVAHSGVAEGYGELLEIPVGTNGHEGGNLLYSALQEGRYIVRNDIEHDGTVFPWNAEAIKRGIKSCAAFPLMRSDRTYGIIYFCSSDVGFFDEQEEILLKELSSDISYAIENIEREEERKHLEMDRDRIFNYSVDLLCIAGFDGYLKQLNPAWVKTLGWSRVELMSSPYIDFIHQEDRDSMVEAATWLAEGKSALSIENRFLCNDGSYKWLSWNCFPLADEKIVFAVLRDVTEQKLSEARRQSLEAQLIQAQKLESLATLAGGVAHDFNNILGIIMGYASDLKRGELRPEKIARSADAIENAATGVPWS